MVDDSLTTGKKLKAIMAAASRRLDAEKESINALNVFPVPDGDTGTNMCLTVAAAVREMDKVTSSSLGETVKAMALGSLMGARGNSGVILSQLFRGISKSLQDHRSATSLQMAWALQEGVETAYKAVMKPVEGTILTVAREMARAALQGAKKGSTLPEVVEAVVLRGREVLARTPDMLPVLKQAGVVDAGGMGLVCLMEGALEAVGGTASTASVQAQAEARPVRPSLAVTPAEAQDIRFTYDTQLLIKGSRLPVDRIRSELDPLGDSLLVVGDPHVVKVHVHTNEPQGVLRICLGHGDLLEASVENMREQREAVQRSRLAAAAPDGSLARAPLPAPTQSGGGDTVRQLLALPDVKPPPSPGPGVVVVASGKGLEEILRNLGADVVVSGGQTMNPSTEDILRAVESLPHQEVIILPNNGNIHLAAKQTVELTRKKVRVIPSRSIPQGLAALVALNRSLDAEKNEQRMEEALGHVRSGEVTRAVRDSKYRDIEIRAGEFIGLLDDEIVTVGPEHLAVLTDLVSKMTGANSEIVTVFCGDSMTDAEVGRVAVHLGDAAAGHEIEVHRGGQPLYHYLVSVE